MVCKPSVLPKLCTTDPKSEYAAIAPSAAPAHPRDHWRQHHANLLISHDRPERFLPGARLCGEPFPRQPGCRRLSRQADQDRRSLRTRWRDGPGRPHHGHHHGSGARPARDHRQQARRRHDHRDGCGGQERARRLHARDGHGRACREPEPPGQAALQLRQGVCAGDAGGHFAERARRARRQSIEVGEGFDQRSQSQPWKAVVRLAGRRHVRAPRGRAVQEPDQATSRTFPTEAPALRSPICSAGRST